jgi:hypothetical protein
LFNFELTNESLKLYKPIKKTNTGINISDCLSIDSGVPNKFIAYLKQDSEKQKVK